MFRVSYSIDLSGGHQSTQEIPQFTSALAETCVNSARNSYRLTMRSWIDGSLAMLDHYSAQYLFAAATILAISSLSFDTNSQVDKDDFESASHLLRQMRDLGNISAQEFYHQLEILIQNIGAFEAVRANPMGVPTFEARGNLENSGTEYPIRSDAITSDLGIFGPLVQDFLSQTDAELGVPLPLDDIVFDGLDFWSDVPHQ